MAGKYGRQRLRLSRWNWLLPAKACHWRKVAGRWCRENKKKREKLGR